MSADPVRQIADAVLYEGYLLWPYRHSALKNQRRWTWGRVEPGEALQAQVLLDGCTPAVEAVVRFLQVVAVDDHEEGVEREVRAPGVIDFPPLTGRVETRSEPLRRERHRITVRVVNTSADARLAGAHVILRAAGGSFVSMTEPEANDACENVGTWPALAGPPGDRSTMLCAPFILEDHPRVAPESPGDLFDGAEIDELLVLSILSMTDAERAAMRDADPRARAILERCEALSPEQLMRLHGTLRDPRGTW
jgi:hypothetical protein